MKTTSNSTKRATRQRDPKNTITSFSISKELLDEAKAMAREEKRPLSNLIAVLFEEKILERKRLRENQGVHKG